MALINLTGLFERNKPFDRTTRLRAASEAKARGRHKKALALYEQVLATEPNNAALYREVAPLLVRARRGDEAWTKFRVAAEGFVQKGFIEKAIGIYREAAHYLPRESAVWLALADLQLQRGRREDAVAALLEGRRHFKQRRWRKQAMQLLSRAHQIAPTHFQAGFDLARLRSKTGDRKGAWALYEEIIRIASRRQRQRVRAAQFWLVPGPFTALRWLRTLIFGRYRAPSRRLPAPARRAAPRCRSGPGLCTARRGC